MSLSRYGRNRREGVRLYSRMTVEKTCRCYLTVISPIAPWLSLPGPAE